MKKLICILCFACLIGTPAFAADDVAELKTSITILQTQVASNGRTSTEILSTLRGCGGEQGLVTAVAVNRNSITSLQTWMLSISVFILGLVGWSIKMKLSKG